MNDRKWQDVKLTGDMAYTDVANWAMAKSPLISVTKPKKPQPVPVKRVSIRLEMEDGSVIDHEVRKEECVIRLDSSHGEFYTDANGNEQLRVTGQTISLSGLAGNTTFIMPDGSIMSVAQAMAIMFGHWAE